MILTSVVSFSSGSLGQEVDSNQFAGAQGAKAAQ
jgi:hypothetical protein